MNAQNVEQILARRKTLNSVKGPRPSITDNVARILAKKAENSAVTVGERLNSADIKSAIEVLTKQLATNQAEELSYMEAVAAKAQTDAEAAKAALNATATAPAN